MNPLQKIMNKITTLAEFEASNDETTLVGGCFDILHIGHIRFLQAAKKTGTQLIIALESDEFIHKNKHREPFHSQQERAEMLAELESVDMVIKLPLMSSNDDYANLVKTVQPNVIAITENDPNENYKKEHAALVDAEVKTVITEVPRKSTTEVLKTHPKKTLKSL